MDNRKFFGFVRKALAGALFGMAALAGTTALAEVTIDGVTVAGDSVQSLHGGTIRINVEVSEDIVRVSEGAEPYIELDNISNFASTTAGKQRATYAGFAGRELYFNYPIQAGDYSSGVDVFGRLHLNGATITAKHSNGTEENLSDGMELPSILGDYTIRISTFYFSLEDSATGVSVFTNRVVVPDSKAKVGKNYSIEINAGGGTLSSSVRFAVQAMCEDNVKFYIRENDANGSFQTISSDGGPCYITLPTDGMVTLIATPQTRKTKEIKLRIRPTSSGGDNSADLYIVYPDGVEEEEVSIESISVASADDTVYGYNKPIRIMVEFSDDIRSVTSSSSSQPLLVLNVNNQNNDSVNTTANTFKDFAAYDSSRPFKGNKMYFLYTVKAGDYVKDLDVTDVQNFFGSSISFDSGADFDGDVPTGTDSRSLASNSNVGIQTIIFSDYSTATPDITVVEDMTLNLVISRGGAATKAQNFSITSFGENGETLRSGDKISWPSTQGFSIPANSDRATLEVTAVEAGTQILRLHPQGYDGTDGDLVATFTVTPGTTLPSVQLAGPSSVEEGADPFTVNVSLSKPAKESVTVEVKSANHNCLSIASTSSGTMRHNSTDGDYAVITFPAYSTAAVALTVNPLDGLVNGSNTVALEATHITNRTTKAVYSSYTHSVRVVNKPPEVSVSPTDEDGNWLVTGFAAMSEGVLTWTASDASGVDLRNGISASIDFGDGTSTNVTCTASGGGMVRHSYIKANGNEEKLSGGYTVQLTVVDKDGGQNTVRGRVIVNPPVIGLIQEYKRDGGNTYKSEQTQATLKGLGEGSVIDMNNTERNPYHPPYDWHSYYNAGQGPVLFTGEPASFDGTHPATGEAATFDSFFHVWIGENFTTEGVLDPARHQRTATVDITDDTSEFTIGAVFSKEFYPEDNYADADNDRLPDDWENAAWPGVYAFEHTGGSDEAPYGTGDNPDHDYLPACAVILSDGTLGTSGSDYSPNGTAFDNRYEVRGTHWGLNARGSDPAGPQDEPHGTYNKFSGFYGTDPTSADTDGDLLTDGWEYFFWRLASFPPTETVVEGEGDDAVETQVEQPVGWRYDPASVISGLPIDSAEIVETFNPCEKASHLTLDTDGDGLTNFEEFLLGTNPVNWDTDGDTMNDGWEVMWGLDAKKNDAGKNEDKDAMAYHVNDDGSVLMHNEVYQTFGFNPRTAWMPGGLNDRARVGADRWFGFQVDTIEFANYYEHALGRWFIDQGYVAEVEPMSRGWMSQPVPYGTSHYYNPTWRDTANHVPNHATKAGDSSASGEGKSYTVPYGDLAYLVTEAPAITVKIDGVDYPCHGCDSDCDGMPDGWELYLCAQPREAADESGEEGGDGGDGDDGDEGASASAPVLDGLNFASRDHRVLHDDDGLVAVEECHSVELCDYYGRFCENFFYNASGKPTYGNWYNKWWPTDPFNADTDGDGLSDSEEGKLFRYQTREFSFLEQDLPYPEYPIEGQLGAIFGSSTMRRGHVPGGGLNPCCVDTDMDYIPDAWEAQFKGENRDLDWEGGFCNRPGEESALVVDHGMVTFKSGGGGMDGTYFDSRVAFDEFLGKNVSISNQVNYVRKADGIYRDFDFDHDGLDNYQEYLINGVRHFQYDKWEAGNGYGGYDIQEIFDTGLIYDWDWAKDADNWQNDLTATDAEHLPFAYMPPEMRLEPYSGTDPRLAAFDPREIAALDVDAAEEALAKLRYASTDPRLADSDGDNMDDYYEMFHGLNPILSDVADYCGKITGNPANEGLEYNKEFIYDFLKYPWMAGMPGADPDYDDKPNWEEALSPSQPAPANHNTDPSPLWMTDMSYSNSFVNLYYNWGTAANFWTVNGGEKYDRYPNPSMMALKEQELLGIVVEPRPAYMFSFECNEGYDTDNDNIPDPYEVDGVAGGATDPQNPDRPVGRKALYLDGNAAARTRSLCAFGPNALRSFTIEAWVMPEAPVSADTQVILERPVAWEVGNAATNTPAAMSGIRRNFRLGLTPAGKPFVEFDNGGADLITESAIAGNGAALEANRWYHLAAVMDGFSKTLSLYVDGERVATKATRAVPYTGFNDTTINPVGGQQYLKASWAPLLVGAADSNPEGKVDGGEFYNNGAIEEIEGGQPQLSNFFKGWVDEIRIWDGARPAGDDAGDQRVAYWGWPTIKDDYDNLKRYGLDEALAAQNDAIKYMQRVFDYRHCKVDDELGLFNTETNSVSYWSLNASGATFQDFRQKFTEYVQMTGGEDNIVRIPPALLCAYSFDALPDADYEYRQPAKFETLSEYRPADYVGGTPWLAGADDRTLVYREGATRYPFPQYAQNWVAWLPLSHIVSNGYDTGYSAIREGVVRYPLYTLRADSVANSKYWTRDAKGGVPVNDLKEFSGWQSGTIGGVTTNINGGLFNDFPNSANPYGYRYETGLSRTDEIHPIGLLPSTFAPEDSALFNDLLPLRNARADMAVQMWDDPDGDGMGVNVDSDGDGLPDWWELENGLDPHNADQNGNGVMDAYDDFDGDGLSNYAEHRAGTNPRSVDSDGDGLADFFETPDGSGLTYGTLYMDNDHVLDGFEQQWDDRYASPFRYDEDEDRDLDGWDNWSEALVSPATKLEYNDFNETSGESSVAEASIDDKAANFPMPALTMTLHYSGDRVSGSGGSGNSGRLVVHAYTSAEMNGWPDVVLAKSFASDTFPVVVELDKEDVIYGHLRQGANWFFAWVEQDGSKLDNVNIGGPTSGALGGNWPTWTPGEPAAVADYQAVNGIGIGWDRNILSFHLVENPQGYVRYSFQNRASANEDHTVSVRTQGNAFFTKRLKWPRVWLHEGDMQSGGNLGYGVVSGIVSDKPNTYGVTVDGVDGGSVTNWFTTTLAAPTLKAPRDNGVVFSARPEFEFALPDEATAFQITVKRGSAQVYSARVPAPGRNPSADSSSTFWKLPASVALEAGATYTWTVQAYNAANASGSAAATATFAIASPVQHDNMPAYGRVIVDVKYPAGWAYRNSATPRLIVRAYRTASFNGDAEAQVALAGADGATLFGLELDTPHYFMAFIDQDGDGVRDTWEPWGYYRKPGDAQPFLPVAVTPQPFGNTQPYEIVLRDPDTDNDLMPDSVEYVLYGAAHPNDFLAQAGANANIGSLRASASALSAAGRSAAIAALVDDAYGDADGDGVSDMVELMRDGTDATSADSDGDGIDDGDEKALFGSAAAAKEAQTLEITGISIDDNGDVTFEWGWSKASVPEAAAVRSATASAAGSAPATGGLRRASAPPPVTGLRYVIEATDSLSEPNWHEVKRVGALNGEVSGGTLPESETGAMFFRIRLEK